MKYTQVFAGLAVQLASGPFCSDAWIFLLPMGLKWLQVLRRQPNRNQLHSLFHIMAGCSVLFFLYDSYYYARPLPRFSYPNASPRVSGWKPPSQVWVPINGLLQSLQASEISTNMFYTWWVFPFFDAPLLFGWGSTMFLCFRLCHQLAFSKKSIEVVNIETLRKVSNHPQKEVNILQRQAFLERTSEHEM